MATSPNIAKKNSVFIASSLDGFIADQNGSIDWLHSFPNPDNIDMGYAEFMAQIDAIVMGRTTFETVCNFDMEWPYRQTVFVLSNTLQQIPSTHRNKAQLVRGSVKEILAQIHQQNYHRLYIDGGKTIQHFLREDAIDEMIITTIPILLGDGYRLFGELPHPLSFRCAESKIFLEGIVQNRFCKMKK